MSKWLFIYVEIVFAVVLATAAIECPFIWLKFLAGAFVPVPLWMAYEIWKDWQ